MKIAICGLINNENLGEKFISTSLCWIIKKEWRVHGGTGEIDFVDVDITGKEYTEESYLGFVEKRKKTLWHYNMLGMPLDFVYASLKKAAQKMPWRILTNGINRFRRIIWLVGINQRSRLKKYMLEKFDGADAIIVDGAGLLEYSKNEYQELLLLISELGEQFNVPVIYNAIGKAGVIDPKDYQYRILKKAFQYDCVKYVSARDSVEDVQECVGKRLPVRLLADAAFCLNLASGIKAAPEKGLVGIGLIHGKAFTMYGVTFTASDWIRLYCDLAHELKKRGYRYVFFTNGMGEDYEVGQKVIRELGVDSNYLVERPVRYEQLLQTISRFEGMITCRMHSSIAAFTMGIPSVILSWNGKVNQYMESIGYPERAIELQNMNARFIVDRYEQALRKGVSEKMIESMREKAIQSVDGFIDLILPKKESA